MIDKLKYSADNHGKIVREKKTRTYRVYGIQLKRHIWESWAEKRAQSICRTKKNVDGCKRHQFTCKGKKLRIIANLAFLTKT